MALKKLAYRPATPKVTRTDDVARMIGILNEAGYRVRGALLQLLWEDFSASNCCGWRILPADDAELLSILLAGCGEAPIPDFDGCSMPSHWYSRYKG